LLLEVLLETLEKKKRGKLISQRVSGDENRCTHNRPAVRLVLLKKAERYSGSQRAG
jgi:hypothetical protein